MLSNDGKRNRSSEFDALCVKLHDEGFLSNSGEKYQSNIAGLTDIVVDILSVELSDHEQMMASSILLDLVKKAENDLKKSLAFRLSTMENLPYDLVLFLANQDLDISEPILKNSPCFSEMDLLYFMHAKDITYWRIIAQRQSLGEKTIITLAEKKDLKTSENLLRNEAIKIPKTAMEMFCELTLEHDDFADLIAERPELDQEILSAIYEKVSQNLRDQIVAHFDIKTSIVDENIDAVTQEFVSITFGDYTITPEIQKMVAKLKETHNLTKYSIMRALNNGQTASFIAMLSEYCGLDTQTVYESMCQPSGQALAIIARAGDFAKNEFLTMLAMTKALRETQCHDAQNTASSKSLKYFDRITRDVALRLINKPIK